MQNNDPYQLSAEKAFDPPPGFAERMKYLGPGFILSASIVGSGELIATTYLGAQAGFILFWVVIMSCLVKVAVQLEFGKHAIHSGKTTMQSFNDLPGPKFGKANWSIWLWLAIMLLKMLQVGGIIGLVAMLLAKLGGPEAMWVGLLVIAVALIVRGGFYRPIEKWSLIMIGLFTVFTVVSLISLQWTPMAISWYQVSSGLSFSIPDKESLLVALAVFGIVGVGGDEIMAYNYWLIEKGYAANTGPREDTEAWNQRAKGWISVMYWDALLALAAYTIVTAVFYMLGAAVLHSQSLLPEKDKVIDVLAKIYTDSLGSWALPFFLVGAFVVLFSTLLAALAAWTRLFSDAFGQIGVLNFRDLKERHRWIGILSWVIPSIWGICYLFMKAPAAMVLIGGAATTAILLIVVFATVIMRYCWLPTSLKPSRVYDVILVISMLAIAFVGVWVFYNTIKKTTTAEAPPAAEEPAEG
jgi:Mn2+/Fe2+ NRAMP family transporter